MDLKKSTSIISTVRLCPCSCSACADAMNVARFSTGQTIDVVQLAQLRFELALLRDLLLEVMSRDFHRAGAFVGFLGQ
jgi:hypothetical protein